MKDIALSERIRTALSGRKNVSERKMFGGVCFMINGNMCAGTWKDSLLVRLDKSLHKETLAEPHAKPVDMNGRILKGWALVEPPGIESEPKLTAWLERAVDFTESLPAK